MYEDINITLLGGDRRQIYAAGRLCELCGRLKVCGVSRESIDATCFGGSERLFFAESADEAVRDSRVILLPVPASSDGVHVNAPLDRVGTVSELKLSSVVRMCEKGSVIIGGKLPEAFVRAAEDKGLLVYDLLGLECFEIANAYTTAEAALSIALNSLTINLKDARVAVTGFGRISKHLCRLLFLLGAEVTVAARRESDLAWARSLGYKTVQIGKENWSCELMNNYNIIYNTVPSVIFDREFLSGVDKSTRLIELASVPGGFDVCAAHELGANISWALSLPGKYAPESAGGIIADSVMKILEEVRL